MDKTYEKLTPELYKSELEPFIAKNVCLYNTSAPWLHWHESVEFLRCKTSSGEALINGTEYSFDEGDIIAVNSGSPHIINSNDLWGLNYSYLIINSDFLKENGIDAQKLHISVHIHDKRACELFDRAIFACHSYDEHSALKSRTAVQNFLLYIIENHLDSSESHSEISSIDEIKKAVNYIRNNYNQDITLQMVASVAGFSVCYFSRKFKKVTGQTFITFLNSVRCENADKLLKNGAKVSDVCYECGFSDPSYFSRTFKSLMGYAPSTSNKK